MGNIDNTASNSIDGSIRIKSNLKISVNDNGEYILIPIEDAQFICKFYDMIDNFSSLIDNVQSRCEGKTEKEQVLVITDELQNITAELDYMFGENCCKKVFGDIVPTPYLLGDFFDQLIPIMSNYTDERQKKIVEKYNRSRNGGNDKNVPSLQKGRNRHQRRHQ